MKQCPGFSPRRHTAVRPAGSNSLRTYQVLLLFLLLFPFQRASQCVKMHLLSDFDRSTVGLWCVRMRVCLCFPSCGRGGPLSCRSWHWLMRFIDKSAIMARKLAKELQCHRGMSESQSKAERDDLYLPSNPSLWGTRVCRLLYVNEPVNNRCVFEVTSDLRYFNELMWRTAKRPRLFHLD